MNKRIWITLSVISVLCILLCSFVVIGRVDRKRTNEVKKVNSEQGIYYEPVDSSVISFNVTGLDQYACIALHYNNQIYTSNANLYFDTGINLNDLEDKIGTVYGNRFVMWSTDKKELYKSTCEGTLYSLKGFDSSFLVVIAYKQLINNSTIIRPYIKLNDITLINGEQLYKDRFHIEDSSSIYCINSKDYAPYKRNGSMISINDTIFKDFLQSLYQSKLIKQTDEITTSQNNSDYVILTFTYDNKLLIECNVYKNGYVSYSDGNSTFCIKMDDKKCSKLIELANK